MVDERVDHLIHARVGQYEAIGSMISVIVRVMDRSPVLEAT